MHQLPPIFGPGAGPGARRKAGPGRARTSAWLLFLAALFGLTGLPAERAVAEERMLSSPEIQVLLSGNTARSRLNGPTLQFFDPSGVTLYQGQGAEGLVGKWRIEPGSHNYCIRWGGDEDGWSCYHVLSDGRHYYWYAPDRGKGEYRVPFVIMKGNEMARN